MSKDQSERQQNSHIFHHLYAINQFEIAESNDEEKKQ
jgi:hypothetical protein